MYSGSKGWGGEWARVGVGGAQPERTKAGVLLWKMEKIMILPELEWESFCWLYALRGLVNVYSLLSCGNDDYGRIKFLTSDRV